MTSPNSPPPVNDWRSSGPVVNAWDVQLGPLLAAGAGELAPSPRPPDDGDEDCDVVLPGHLDRRVALALNPLSLPDPDPEMER